jgi:hypothetical protein
VELRFFEGLYRDCFLDRFGLSYRRSSVCQCEGDLIDFFLFNAGDDDGIGYWDGRNVHEEWLTHAGAIGASGELEARGLDIASGNSVAFLWRLSGDYLRRDGRTVRIEYSGFVDTIWLLEFPDGWVLCYLLLSGLIRSLRYQGVLVQCSSLSRVRCW